MIESSSVGAKVYMVLNPRQHQGHFGEAFVHVLAAAAGLTVDKMQLDVTGIDLRIGYKGWIGSMRHPLIEVQVKSWSRSSAKCAEGYWKYRMRTAHFNDLAGPNLGVPRFLALVIVPDDSEQYAVGGKDAVALQHCAYWTSLKERALVDQDIQATVSVDVPLRNVLTARSLLGLVTGEPSRKVGS